MRLRFFAFVGGLGVSGSLVGRIPRRSVTSSRHSKNDFVVVVHSTDRYGLTGGH